MTVKSAMLYNPHLKEALQAHCRICQCLGFIYVS